jgi:hypothetical protein
MTLLQVGGAHFQRRDHLAQMLHLLARSTPVSQPIPEKCSRYLGRTALAASRASEFLQVTPPTVSRAIAEQEQSLAIALFDRIRGRLVPTPEGQLFFRDVSVSFVGLDRLRSSAARIRDFGSGAIRIASLAALGSSCPTRSASGPDADPRRPDDFSKMEANGGPEPGSGRDRP